MRSPALDELPSPPPDKLGWPWTEESPQLPERRPDGSSWPGISIVTPSYNQGEFIEETIRSVLLQGYPNLEYIIMDGGSTDNSVAIIKKYEPWLACWVSEPDKGQSHAINKGFRKATGKVLAWLNSDDYFQQSAVATLVELRGKHEDCVGWVGACQEISREGSPIREVRKPRVGSKGQLGNWGVEAFFCQPSCFFDSRLFTDVGGLDERLHYAMDLDLWLRLSELGDFASTDEVVSYYRYYASAKTFRDDPMREAEVIASNFNRGMPEVARMRLVHHVSLALDKMPLRALLVYLARRVGHGLWHLIRS